jgi:hypothetical protein
VFVSPTVVSLSSAIASAKGPGNIVRRPLCYWCIICTQSDCLVTSLR